MEDRNNSSFILRDNQGNCSSIIVFSGIYYLLHQWIWSTGYLTVLQYKKGTRPMAKMENNANASLKGH